MKKVRILTNIDANHGSCIINVSINTLISNLDDGIEVKFLDFLNPEYRIMELLRTLKPNKTIPFYNLQRYTTISIHYLIHSNLIENVMKS